MSRKREPITTPETDSEPMLPEAVVRELRGAFGEVRPDANLEFSEYSEEEFRLALQDEDQRRVFWVRVGGYVKVAAGVMLALSVFWVASRPLGGGSGQKAGGPGSVDGSTAAAGAEGAGGEGGTGPDGMKLAGGPGRSNGAGPAGGALAEVEDLNGDGVRDAADLLLAARRFEAAQGGTAVDPGATQGPERMNAPVPRDVDQYVARLLGLPDAGAVAAQRRGEAARTARAHSDGGTTRVGNSAAPAGGNPGTANLSGDGGAPAGEAESGANAGAGLARPGVESGAGSDAGGGGAVGPNSATPGAEAAGGRRVVYDVVIDAQDAVVGSYQAEIRLNLPAGSDGQMVLEDVEGGVPPVFANRPYYSGVEMGQKGQDFRFQLLGFDAGNELPRGKIVVARIVLQVKSGSVPVGEAGLKSAATVTAEGVRPIKRARVELRPAGVISNNVEGLGAGGQPVRNEK